MLEDNTPSFVQTFIQISESTVQVEIVQLSVCLLKENLWGQANQRVRETVCVAFLQQVGWERGVQIFLLKKRVDFKCLVGKNCDCWNWNIWIWI